MAKRPESKWSLIQKTDLRSGKGEVIYRVRCECGLEKLMVSSTFNSGRSLSCRSCSDKARAARGWNPVRVQDAPLNNVLLSYKGHARKRGNSFSITDEQFKQLMLQDCFYCGAIPANKARSDGREVMLYNGVDRRDNTLGYSEDNCVPCCKICNRMKMDLGEQQMYRHMQKVLKHRGLSGG